jgi:hypothetical protein
MTQIQSRYLIIVSRNRPDLCGHPRDALKGEDIEVLLDRREAPMGPEGGTSGDVSLPPRMM